MGRHLQKLMNITLEEAYAVRRKPEVEHNRKVALFDLLEENYFAPVGNFNGPYDLRLSVAENRMAFDVRNEGGDPLTVVMLPLSPFRTIVRDYFVICESYYGAIRKSTPAQIEAIDMGRRGLHNEGAELLRARLAGKIDIDGDTSRRLFTLICVLHVKG